VRGPLRLFEEGLFHARRPHFSRAVRGLTRSGSTSGTGCARRIREPPGGISSCAEHAADGAAENLR